MKRYCLILSLALLSACATPNQHANWVMVDGSKSDGVVTLGIDVPAQIGVRETSVRWNDAQADAEADRRCKSWGYSGADLFRGGQLPVIKVCHAEGFSPCWSKTYRIQYQCTDVK